ncbi:hypothetical protein BT96DRAFT_979934 [Gymnopus androsaceus JB14]|uniref:Uncharacterized protein n=1 Tax=Gymnopus androsaceus JB14 TaxID=1447944 RepID=A0A6A4H0D8_9AGAR|nr:hypothetical protein BT96DRAFT_979934 [Gymnopus androsaceus JB14]
MHIGHFGLGELASTNSCNVPVKSSHCLSNSEEKNAQIEKASKQRKDDPNVHSPDNPPTVSGNQWKNRRLFAARVCVVFIAVMYFTWIAARHGLVNIKKITAPVTSNLRPLPLVLFAESDSSVWSCRPHSAIDGASGSVSTQLFQLPTDSNGLFLTSEGASVNGNIKVEVADEPACRGSGNMLFVNVSTYHNSGAPLNSEFAPRICGMNSPVDGFYGVGVFDAVSPYDAEHKVSETPTNITITLPRTVNGDPLVISNFIALSADHAVIRTNESPIEGEFEVTDTLELDTANAPIRVGVKMVNDRGRFTRLKMTTSNSPITVDLELTGSKDYNEFASGRFSIEAKSTNAQVVIRHLSASVGSTVMLNAETTNAPMDVQMHPTYEGSFALKTTNAKHNDVDCLSCKDTNDPEGHGRSRKITLKQIQGGQLASGELQGPARGQWDMQGIARIRLTYKVQQGITRELAFLKLHAI